MTYYLKKYNFYYIHLLSISINLVTTEFIIIFGYQICKSNIMDFIEIYLSYFLIILFHLMTNDDTEKARGVSFINQICTSFFSFYSI